MKVPKAFEKLGEYFPFLFDKNPKIFLILSAASRGTGGEGSVPANTRIIFAIGGWVE